MSPGALRKAIWLTILAVLFLFVAIPTFTHYQMKHRANAYKRTLAAQGEKMRLADLAQALDPEALRRGRLLMEIVDHCGSAEEPLSNQPPFMILVAPGLAIPASCLESLPGNDCTNLWPALADFFRQHADDMQVLRSLALGPPPAFKLDFSSTLNDLNPHISQINKAAALLCAEALLDLKNGQLQRAAECIQALCVLCSNFSEPLIYSETSRMTLTETVSRITWEALQHRGWTDEQLRAIQQAWERINWHSQAEAALAFDRLWQLEIITALRSSNSTPWNDAGNRHDVAGLVEFGQGLTREPVETLKDLLGRYPVYWVWAGWKSYDSELESMETVQQALLAVRRLQTNAPLAPVRKQFLTEAINNFHQHGGGSEGAYYLKPSSSADAFLHTWQAAEVRRAICIVAIALERWHLANGDYPEQLVLLRPRFLDHEIADPADGAPVRYRKRPGGSFLLYCVGENETDERGDPTHSSMVTGVEPPWTLLNYQWWRANDAVWPRQADAEMIALWSEKAAAAATKTANDNQKLRQGMEAFRKRYGLPSK